MRANGNQGGTGIWTGRAPDTEIGPDDVLIKVKKTGICGTDITSTTGTNGLPEPCPCPW